MNIEKSVWRHQVLGLVKIKMKTSLSWNRKRVADSTTQTDEAFLDQCLECLGLCSVRADWRPDEELGLSGRSQ